MINWNGTESPWGLFESWLNEARENSTSNPDAVALATVSRDGRPSVRMVYYRGVRESGLSFFTNFESKKGRQLDLNSTAALLFYWPQLKRQIRIEGSVQKLSPAESDRHFYERSRESQITAAVSKQSRVLSSYELFERELVQFTESHQTEDIDRPMHWGGYKLIPSLLEFWSSGLHRRHHRLQYELRGGEWMLETLYP